MVPSQAPVYELPDISTIEKWQASIYDENNNNIFAAGRFKRYEQLLKEHYGKITVEKGIEILSDRYDPDTGRERGWTEPSPGLNDGVTICLSCPEETLAEGVPYYKSDKRGPIAAQLSNLWSFVVVPADGDIRLAIKEFPAQRGPFEYFNLLEELRRSR